GVYTRSVGALEAVNSRFRSGKRSSTFARTLCSHSCFAAPMASGELPAPSELPFEVAVVPGFIIGGLRRACDVRAGVFVWSDRSAHGQQASVQGLPEPIPEGGGSREPSP